jgi:phosphopantothenoylcysteine decarboxylase/phosphopantothenate--cysteine ligase
MAHLTHRNIVLCVSGGIAAYKSAELVRLLSKAGADVRVVMSRGAQEFITPLTLQALSGYSVHRDLLDENAEAGMGHIELARWADLVLVAPATAETIARLAQGRADDLLTAVVLASPAPLWVAPAMNQEMWAKPATANNIETLKARGVSIIGPDSGEQACGDIGPGRLLEPELILQHLVAEFSAPLLAGHRVVITAGPTREAIDPVRFLSNHSSGKMGFALARAAAEAGARTTLIAGPVELPTPEHVQRIDVVSAAEMLDAALQHSGDASVFIGAAAIADYRPEVTSAHKMKKHGDAGLNLRLVQNPDIISAVSAQSGRPTLVVGFAAETDNVLDNARRKLASKGLDIVIANDVSQSDIGFNSDQNAATWISAEAEQALAQTTKLELARQIISRLAQRLATQER